MISLFSSASLQLFQIADNAATVGEVWAYNSWKFHFNLSLIAYADKSYRGEILSENPIAILHVREQAHRHLEQCTDQQ